MKTDVEVKFKLLLRQNIKERLKTERPISSESSLKTYFSLVLSMAKRLDKTTMPDIIKVKDDAVMEKIERMRSKSSKKTLLSCKKTQKLSCALYCPKTQLPEPITLQNQLLYSFIKNE